MSAQTTENAKTSWYKQLETMTANSTLPPDILIRLVVWRKRFEMYEGKDIEKYMLQPTGWKKNRRFRVEAKKIITAIHAYDQITNSKKSSANAESKQHMQDAILAIIKIKMTKLELDQFKILSRSQNEFTRAMDNHAKNILADDLEKQRAESDNAFRSNSKAYIRLARKEELHHTHQFFKQHERRWHYDKHLQTAQTISLGLRFFNSASYLFMKIAELLPSLTALGATIGGWLMIVPYVGSAFSAIPLILTFIKVELKSQSRIKRALAVFGLIMVAAGLVAAGFTALTATIIGASLIAIGSFVNIFVPFVKTQQMIGRHRKELAELKNTDKIQEKIRALTARERQYLMLTIEDDYLSNLSIALRGKNAKKDEAQFTAEFTKLRQSVLEDDFASLSVNLALDAIISRQKTGKTLESFLLANVDVRIKQLETEIVRLKAIEKGLQIGLFNTALAIAGTITILFNPLAGAILFFIPALIGVAQHFQWKEKIIDWYKKKTAADLFFVAVNSVICVTALVMLCSPLAPIPVIAGSLAAIVVSCIGIDTIGKKLLNGVQAIKNFFTHRKPAHAVAKSTSVSLADIMEQKKNLKPVEEKPAAALSAKTTTLQHQSPLGANSFIQTPTKQKDDREGEGEGKKINKHP